MVPLVLPPKAPVAIVSLAAGQTAASVSLAAQSPLVWLRFSSAASADVALSAITPRGLRRSFVRAAPACAVAAGRRICTYRMTGATGRWRIELHKRSTAPAVVRVQLIEQPVTTEPPPR